MVEYPQIPHSISGISASVLYLFFAHSNVFNHSSAEESWGTQFIQVSELRFQNLPPNTWDW